MTDTKPPITLVRQWMYNLTPYCLLRDGDTLWLYMGMMGFPAPDTDDWDLDELVTMINESQGERV